MICYIRCDFGLSVGMSYILVPIKESPDVTRAFNRVHTTSRNEPQRIRVHVFPCLKVGAILVSNAKDAQQESSARNVVWKCQVDCPTSPLPRVPFRDARTFVRSASESFAMHTISRAKQNPTDV